MEPTLLNLLADSAMPGFPGGSVSAPDVTVPVYTPFPFGKVCSNILLLLNLSTQVYDRVRIPTEIPARQGYIETANTMGRADIEIDQLVKTFLSYSRTHAGPKLDLGAGVGISTARAMQASPDEIISMDIDIRHLITTHKYLAAKHADDPLAFQQESLKLYFGSFPNGMHFEKETLQAILAARVIHFLPPQATVKGLRKLWEAALPQAHLFISASTPFSKKFRHFLPEYIDRRRSYMENRKRDIHLYGRGLRFPGATHLEQHCPNYRSECPDNLWLYEPETLADVVHRSGWKVVEVFAYPEPRSRRENHYFGEERVGVIAVKDTAPLEETLTAQQWRVRVADPVAPDATFAARFTSFRSLGFEWQRGLVQNAVSYPYTHPVTELPPRFQPRYQLTLPPP